jgi:ribonuclease P protein component
MIMQAKAKDLQNLGRLKKRSEFLCAAQSGFKWVSPSVIMQLDPNPKAQKQSPQIHFGVTATKKLGCAPQRSRIKRRLRAALKDVIAERQELFQNINGANLVLIGRDATTDIDYKQLKKDMSWCLKRLSQKLMENDNNRGVR